MSTGAVGAVGINLKVGGVDLSTSCDEITIHESIYDSSGPACEFRIVDAEDKITKNGFNSSKDVEVNLTDVSSAASGGRSSFKMSLWEGANLNDESQYKQGSLHAKSYSLRAVSPEFKNAQGNYANFGTKDKTTNIAKKVLQENYKTDKSIEVDEESETSRSWTTHTEHPFATMQKLNDAHVGTQSKSSAFAVFQTQQEGQQKYKITTWEKMFQQSPVATFTQSTTNVDPNNGVMWINVNENFAGAADHTEVSSLQTLNLTTHGVIDRDPEPTKFTLPGKEVDSTTNSNLKKVPQRTVFSKVNEDERISSAKDKKAQFMHDLAQNSCEFEIPYNSKVTVGCMINLNLPNRTDATLGAGSEQQFAGPVLVTHVTTRVRPRGKPSEDGKTSVQASQIVKAVKASYQS